MNKFCYKLWLTIFLTNFVNNNISLNILLTTVDNIFLTTYAYNFLKKTFVHKFFSQLFFRAMFLSITYINPQTPGGGPNGPQQIKNVISLEPNVRLTSNQAVNLSFYIVLRSI